MKNIKRFLNWFLFYRRYKQRRLLIKIGAVVAIELQSNRKFRKLLKKFPRLEGRLNYTFNKYGKKNG